MNCDINLITFKGFLKIVSNQEAGAIISSIAWLASIGQAWPSKAQVSISSSTRSGEELRTFHEVWHVAQKARFAVVVRKDPDIRRSPSKRIWNDDH